MSNNNSWNDESVKYAKSVIQQLQMLPPKLKKMVESQSDRYIKERMIRTKVTDYIILGEIIIEVLKKEGLNP